MSYIILIEIESMSTYKDNKVDNKDAIYYSIYAKNLMQKEKM